MNIAVTGANGRLGTEVIKALQGLGMDSVIGLARTPAKAEYLKVEIREGDYSTPEALKASLRGVDTVLLVSGMDAPDKRIEQHRNVIRAAKAASVRKIVYTSVQGAESGTAFSPVIQSKRQTEQDVRESGLDWVIGRNGIYIESDIEYIDTYKRMGAIANCAGDGRCGYTTRPELGYAYAKMLTENKHNGQTYNLHGDLLTQRELSSYLSNAFGTTLKYTPMTVDAFRTERIAELGNFIGEVVAGIYEGIGIGAHNKPSQFTQASGREHQSWNSYFASLRGV